MKTVNGWLDPTNYPGAEEAAYPFAVGRWLGSSLKNGPWGQRLGEPGVQTNYGAIAQKLGIPLSWAQRAAGLAEQLEPIFGRTGGSSEKNHVKVDPLAPFFGEWPYGDSRGGSLNIEGGYEAAKAQGRRNR